MKFNFLSNKKNAATNYENATAFTLTPEIELYASVVTTGLNDSFYEKNSERLERIKTLIAKCDVEFVAKLAVYARTEMHLRSIPLVLSVELAKQTSGTALVSKTISKVVQRADEITELLACYQMANERTATKKLNSFSKQVQKGLAQSFNQFDEYQFAKYNKNTDVKLKDALFLVHPKAKDESQQEIFDKIANGTLATPYTWETELSQLGQHHFENAEAKSAAFKSIWEALISSRKMGYMAVLRNVRNILEANVSAAHIEMVCHYLANEKAVLGSKQLPFRFLSAYRELKNIESPFVSAVLQALEDAVMISAKNINGFGYTTSVVIACDVSGSMQKAISAKSKVQLYDIGLILAMLMQSQCKNVITGMFGDIWKAIAVPKNNVLANADAFYRREGEVGYATNGHLILHDLIIKRTIADKVMVFTDTQMWDSTATSSSFSKLWKMYKQVAPKAKLYLFDLAGYGNVPLDIRQNDVYLIAGWSDKVFDILAAMENSQSTLAKIHQIEL